jgi:hypothetical protein
VSTPFSAEVGFDDNDGEFITRPPWVMGGNTDKLEEPCYGMDMAGNTTLSNLDEREVMSDTVSATPIRFDSANSETEWAGNRQGVYRRGA